MLPFAVVVAVVVLTLNYWWYSSIAIPSAMVCGVARWFSVPLDAKLGREFDPGEPFFFLKYFLK